jgi:hypothetical protein
MNLFKLSSSSLVRKLRGGFLVCRNHFEKNSFLFKFAVNDSTDSRSQLELEPARPSLRLRVKPSLRLGTRQTLALQQHQISS